MMMQSMSNSGSYKMQQEYADEIMKQQILKICQENAKMESVIALTDTRTSSPPGDAVLVALSSTTDISATEINSGLIEQKQVNNNIFNVHIDDEMRS